MRNPPQRDKAFGRPHVATGARSSSARPSRIFRLRKFYSKGPQPDTRR